MILCACSERTIKCKPKQSRSAVSCRSFRYRILRDLRSRHHPHHISPILYEFSQKGSETECDHTHSTTGTADPAAFVSRILPTATHHQCHNYNDHIQQQPPFHESVAHLHARGPRTSVTGLVPWRQALVLGVPGFGVSSPARRRTWRCKRRKPGCAVHAPSPVRRTCRLAPPPRLAPAVAEVPGAGAWASPHRR